MNTLNSLALKEIISKRKYLLEKTVDDLEQSEIKSLKLSKKLEAVEKAQLLIQTAAHKIESSIAYHLSDLVNTPLQALFPGNVFDIEFTTKNNSSHAAITVEKGGSKQAPLDSAGGGLADVVALGLRLAVWSMGKTADLLCLDEPAKNLDEIRSPIMTTLLKDISSQLKVQVFMATHKEDQIDSADRVYKVIQKFNKKVKYRVSKVNLIR